MKMKVKGITRSEFMGFRISPIVKNKIEKYAKKNGFSVGELLTLSVLLHMKDKTEAGKLLIQKEIQKKTSK